MKLLYEYKCDKCSLYFEELNTVENRANMSCPQCSGKARKVLNTSLRVSIFPEGWWSNIGPKPIYVKSASQLAEECRKNWTPTNKPWPEYLDGISNPGVPYEVKQKGAEGHKTEEELCKLKTERIRQLVEKSQQAKEMLS